MIIIHITINANISLLYIAAGKINNSQKTLPQCGIYLFQLVYLLDKEIAIATSHLGAIGSNCRDSPGFLANVPGTRRLYHCSVSVGPG